MKYHASACGKLILSGEYAVVFGYPGIAIPAPCTVTATFHSTHHDTLSITHSGIDNETYLHHILNAVTAITGPLRGRLTIENTIPVGRGMGSSTALVIAICRCLLDHPPLPSKNLALSIEATVNPGHSGIDFDVIWNEKPTLFQKGKPPQIIDNTINRLMGTCSSQVLIDSGKPHETTAEMVKWVKERLGNPHPHPLPSKGEGMRALQTIAHCTERLLAGESPITVFRDHHRAQVALGVVPEPVQALIADIERAGGAAKVVGAGGRSSEGTKIPSEARSAEPREGGGMVLALHQKPEKLHAIAQQHHMPTLALTQIHPPLPSLP